VISLGICFLALWFWGTPPCLYFPYYTPLRGRWARTDALWHSVQALRGQAGCVEFTAPSLPHLPSSL
jgi:hypothetical protein